MLFLIFYALFKTVLGIRVIISRTLTVALTRLVIAALTVVSALLPVSATRLIAALTLITLARLIASAALLCALFAVIIIVTGTVTAVVARLIALLTRLVSALLLIIVITRTVTAVALLSVTVALLISLTGLVSALLIVVVTRTVAALLSPIMLQTGSEPFGTEAPGIVVVASVCVVRTPLVNARTHLTTYRSVALIVCFPVAVTAVLVLLCRLFVLHVVKFFCHFFSLL